MRCEVMERSGVPEEEEEIWGTWEELLLACAVGRHGARSWDSVAVEVQARIPAGRLLTPEGCKQRYHHLQRRFASHADEIDDQEAARGEGGRESATEIPWLEELRSLRLAELRREVQRYDVSIVSLRLKVKKLKEERERSLLEAAAGEGGSDLRAEEERKDGESPGSEPGDVHTDRISCEDSGRSCKESNSTDPEKDAEKSLEGGGHREEAPGAGSGGADPIVRGDEKSVGEGSYNGSSDTIARIVAEANQARPQEVGESGESVTESKDEEGEGSKESSDVQSSAGLYRRRRGRRRTVVHGRTSGSSGGEKREAEAVSPARDRIAAASQPLLALLEIIRSQRCGSVFERRLESQEGSLYRGLIRRHVDLEMVQSRIVVGEAYTTAEFFRDLLLLCNNAIVYYPQSSPESISAVHLRRLVSKEMAATPRRAGPPPAPPKESTPPPPPPPPPPTVIPKLKSAPDDGKSTPAPLAPLIACRKRSSVSAKAAETVPVLLEKEERELKPDLLRKEREMEEGLALEVTMGGYAVSGARGPRTIKNRRNSGNRLEVGAALKSPNPSLDSKVEHILAENTSEPVVKAVAKKRSAANFLNRIGRGSPSSHGSLPETLKSSGRGGRGVDQLKRRVSGRREQAVSRGTRAASAAKQAPERSAPVKRSVGRPPKRSAPPPHQPPVKKSRGEMETALGRSPPSRRRGRR